MKTETKEEIPQSQDQGIALKEIRFSSGSLYVKDVPGKGWGVFSSQKIEKGALIERAPVLALAGEGPDELMHYLYFHEEQGYCVGLGYTSLYNHSHNPNTWWSIDSMSITITAAENIEPDTEIVIDYGWDDYHWEDKK